MDVPSFRRERENMVREQLADRGIRDERVLAAMRKVPRHEFVPSPLRDDAYEDTPLPIGYEQTISQPYMVGLMTELLSVRSNDKVLEIGTGSGYQAAILAELVREVYTVEIVEPLAQRAQATLTRLRYQNVHVRHGDGHKGWPDEAPFDGIIVTAAPEQVPEALVQQLKIGGHMVIPVGVFMQELRRLTRTPHGLHESESVPVRFVPMTREGQED